MLQSRPDQNGKIRTHGFIVAVEIEGDLASPDAVMDKIGDSLTLLEGVGQVEVEHLGEIDVMEGLNVLVKESEEFPPMKES